MAHFSLKKSSTMLKSDMLDQNPEKNCDMKSSKYKHIFVVGAPMTGKTSLCEFSNQYLKFTHIDMAQEKRHLAWVMYGKNIKNQEKRIAKRLDRFIMKKMSSGPTIIQHEKCEIVNPELISKVIFLKTLPSILLKRFRDNGLSDDFAKEVVGSEKEEKLLIDAVTYFGPEKIVLVDSNKLMDLIDGFHVIRQHTK